MTKDEVESLPLDTVYVHTNEVGETKNLKRRFVDGKPCQLVESPSGWRAIFDDVDTFNSCHFVYLHDLNQKGKQ